MKINNNTDYKNYYYADDTKTIGEILDLMKNSKK